MRIALCSSDMSKVDGNFNKSTYFLIYDVSKTGTTFVDVRKPETVKDPYDANDMNRRINAIKDCSMMFCMQIPRTSKARLINRGIFAVRMKQVKEVAVFLEELIDQIKNNASSFPTKTINREELKGGKV